MFGVPERLKRVSLLNPAFARLLWLFLLKEPERTSKFGSILARDRGLVNNCSAAAGRAPNWTGRTLNSSYKNKRLFPPKVNVIFPKSKRYDLSPQK